MGTLLIARLKDYRQIFMGRGIGQVGDDSRLGNGSRDCESIR